MVQSNLKSSKSTNFSAYVAVVLGIIWISYVVAAFGQVFPVYKHGNHIGNVVIANYNAFKKNINGKIYHGAPMRAEFKPKNNDLK